jgi:transmembrane sensor
MNGLKLHDEDARRADAATWVVRLQADGLTAEDAIAFDAWLEESPANAHAYDAALAVAQAYEANAAEIARQLPEARRQLSMPRRYAMAGGAIAAVLAVAVVIAPMRRTDSVDIHQTATGEHRTVTLADGSTVDLNAATRLEVRFSAKGRDVTLAEGEAVFDVVHNAKRPFVIAAGDRTVRVVGTQFDVRRRDGKLSVTVARGAVEVRPIEGAAGKAYRLHPGQRLDHQDGLAAASLTVAEPSEVLGWRARRLVYRGAPLSEVVADLNHQFATPIRVENPELAKTPISGVLILDDQDAVIRRLALLVSVRTVRSGQEIVLK